MNRIVFMSLAVMVLLLGAKAAPAQHECGKCPAAQACPSSTVKADSSKPVEPVFQKLPGVGKRVWIGDSHYFTYKFDKTPKIGVVVLKVQLFTRKGVKDKTFEVTGISGMPSMKGAHDSEAKFKLNRLGDYLLPVNLVMRGEWEVKMIFVKDGQPVFHGVFPFKV